MRTRLHHPAADGIHCCGALLLLIAAERCGAQAQSAPAAATTPSSVPVDAFDLRLLDLGAEPRIPLRFRARSDSTRALRITCQTLTTVALDGVEQRSEATPATQFDCLVTVGAVDDAGSAAFTFVITDADLAASREAHAPTLKAEAALLAARALKGLGGSGVMSDRGVASAARMHAPPGADPAFAAALHKHLSELLLHSRPFPEPAVGIGARWRIVSRDTLGGVESKVVQECTLTAIDADRLTLRIESTQTAAPQPMPGAAAPPGATVWLDEGRVTTLTDVTFDLTHLAPLSEDTRQAVVFEAHSRGGDAPERRMSQRQEIGLTLRQLPDQVSDSRPASRPSEP